MRPKTLLAFLSIVVMLMTATALSSSAEAAPPASPIVIDGDADLIAQATANSWPGDGTAASPFVIANMNIDASMADWRGITVKNTNLYLNITNCVVSGATGGEQTGFGIWLDNSANVTITGSDLSLNDRAIVISYCDNITVDDNYANTSTHGINVAFSRDIAIIGNHIITPSTSAMGIKLYSCSYSEVSGNTVTGPGGGVELVLSHNCTVTNNVMISPDAYYIDPSLHVQLSQDILIDGNIVTVSRGQGFLLVDSSRINIVNNHFTTPGDGNGIFVTGSNNLTFSTNVFIGAGSGIDMHDSDNTTINTNSFDLVSFSIRSVFSNHITISYNDCNGGRYGECIELYGAANNTVSYNTINADESLGIGSGGRGISVVSGSIYNNIVNNTITSGNVGILVTHRSSYNTVSNNSISHTYYGVHIRPADVYDPITYNEVCNNTIYDAYKGIFTEIAAYTIIANNTVDSSDYGIWLDTSAYMWVADNTVSNLNQVGIYLRSLALDDEHLEVGLVHHVNITRNTVTDTVYDGIYANGVVDCSFWDNQVSGCGLIGIHLYLSNDSLVGANYVGYCAEAGFQGQFTADNVFIGNLVEHTDHNAIEVEYSRGYTIVGNLVHFAGGGIYLYDTDETTIVDNIVQHIVQDGIVLDDSYQNVVDRNHVQFFGGIGIVLAYLPPSAPSSLAPALPYDITGNVVTNNHIRSDAPVGILISMTGDNIVRGNYIEVDSDGIYLQRTSGNIVEWNDIVLPERGIYLYDSHDNVLNANNLTHIDVGIHLDLSSGNTVEGNEIREFGTAGIVIGTFGMDGPMATYEGGPSLNTVLRNNISEGNFGIVLESCSDNTVSYNNITTVRFVGILMFDAQANIIDGNNISGGMEYGIYVGDSNGNTIRENTIYEVFCAIWLGDSRDNLIAGNNIHDIIERGIEIMGGWDNVVYENTVTLTEAQGIYIVYGGGNTIIGNTVDRSRDSGISLVQSNGSHIYGNTVIDPWFAGIDLDTCTADIQGNTLINCAITLLLAEDIDQVAYANGMSILSNNTVNGHPVLLVKNVDLAGGAVASGQGQVILINVTRAVVTGQNPECGGVIVVLSDNVTVTANTIADALFGVHVIGSENCTVSSNIITMEESTRGLWSSRGVRVQWSTYITVENNAISLTFSANGPIETEWYGIELAYSDRNIVRGNTVSVVAPMAVDMLMLGICLQDSHDNEVSRNELFVETLQPFSGSGILLSWSSRNDVLWNNVTNMPGIGIYLSWSDRNTVAGNRVYGSGSYGIDISESNYNHVHGNILTFNAGTTEAYDASKSQAFGDGVNWWNSTSYGNYWADLTAPDADHNGIVDVPYPISGGASDPWPVLLWLSAEWPAEWPNYTRIMTTALNGGALDGFGITQVSWYNPANGASGVCTGTTAWNTGTVPLKVGDNLIQIGMHDQAGHVFVYEYLVVCSPGPIPDDWPASMVYDNQDPFQFWLNLTDIAPMASGNWSVYHGGVLIGHGSISGLFDNMEFHQLMNWPVLPGVNTIVVQINDTVGNVAILTMTMFFDEVNPTVTIDWPANGYINSTGTVTVTSHGSDDLSGIDYYLVHINDGTWGPMGGVATFSGLSDGIYTVVVRAVDRAGNYHDAAVTFTVDTTDPELSITAPASGIFILEPSVTVQWDVSDATSGLASVQVRLDEGDWMPAIGLSEMTFSSLGQGDHTIEMVAMDNAGNLAAATVSFTVDSIAPVTIADPTGPSGLNGWYTGDVSIMLQATDAGSGVAGIQYRIADGTWIDYTTALSLTGDGVYVVEYRATDLVGNVEGTHSLTIKIDGTAPDLVITSPANMAWALSNDIDPVFTSSDAQSGISAYNIKVDDGAWSAALSAEQVLFADLPEGEHTLWIRAVDSAGNTAVASVGVKVDTAAPVILNWTSGSGKPVDVIIVLDFSEAMNTTSVTLAMTGGVTGTVIWTGQKASFTPGSDLSYNTTYTVTVTGKDLAGNAVSKVWTLTTTNLGGLSGTVTGPDGSPVAGATVTLGNGMTATTDSQGRFSFLEVGAGTYEMTITGQGYVTATQTATVLPGQDSILEPIGLKASPSNPGTSGDNYLATIAILVAIVVAIAAVLLLVIRNLKS